MKERVHATAVVYRTVNAAHFQLPDSLLIADMTPTHGKYVRIKSIKENAITGVIVFLPETVS